MMNPGMAQRGHYPQAQQRTPQQRRGPGQIAPGNPNLIHPNKNQAQMNEKAKENSLLHYQYDKIKAKEPTDRNLPEGIDEMIIGNGIEEYKRLQEMERKLDSIMMRKRLELQRETHRPSPRARKLRISISNSAENQPWQSKDLDENAFDFNSGSEATYKVRVVGKLLDENGEETTKGDSDVPVTENSGKEDQESKGSEKKSVAPPKQRLSYFFNKIVIELDRAKALQPDASNVIEWKKPARQANSQNPPTSVDFDVLEFERKSDENINCTINLFRDEQPERFILSKELQEIVDEPEATKETVLNSIWLYIKAMGLQRDEDKRAAQTDDTLRAIFGRVDTLHYHKISELITNHLASLPPVKLQYTIRVDQEYQYNPSPTIYEVLVQAPDPLQDKIASILIRDESFKQDVLRIAEIDREIAFIVQQLHHSKARHSFFTSLSKDPGTFIKRWISSQKRDMEIILGDSRVGMGIGLPGNEWMGDEFRRGGANGVWGSENAKEAAGFLVYKPGRWGK